MSSWASFQRRYEKLTAELRKETTESQRKQQPGSSGTKCHSSVTAGVVVYPVSHLSAESGCRPVLAIDPSTVGSRIATHRQPLTPSPSPSDLITSDAQPPTFRPHITSVHVRDLTSTPHIFDNGRDRNANTSLSSTTSSPSPGSLLTPPASKSKSPSPNSEPSVDISSPITTASTSSTNTTTTSSSPFSRSFFVGRFSLGKAGIGYRSLALPQFLANLTIGSPSASNSNISGNRSEGERRASTSSNSADPVSASEVVKTAETVNRIMDTQCLSPRPVRPRPRDLRGLGAGSGGGRASGRFRQDLSFLQNSPARSISSAHHRHSPSGQQEDSIRLSNKFPSNNTLTIDTQVSLGRFVIV